MLTAKEQAGIGSGESGFTLIELSIVLVIIGLIVGGILTGQDLIKAAEQRATIAQIEKYNTAINTFRNKYSCIPGDCAAATATSFGFTATRNGGAGRGDGNGLIDTTVTGQVWGQEPAMFWNDLTFASLLDGSFTVLNVDSAAPVALPTASVPTTLPAAKLGRGNYITVGSLNGVNYYLMAGVTSAAVTTGAYTLTKNITPLEAFSMDKKVDDSMPETGSLQAHAIAAATSTAFADNAAWTSATTPVAGDCVTTGTDGGQSNDTYAVSGTVGSSMGCILRWRFN